jgi:hypothetical protein
MRSSPATNDQCRSHAAAYSRRAQSKAVCNRFVSRQFAIERAGARRMGGALCRPLQAPVRRSGAGNYGVSDPGARAGNGPAPVRRGRSRHGCRCPVSVVCASVVGLGTNANQVHMCARNGTQIFRTIWSRSCGKSWSPNCTRSARDDATGCGLRSHPIVAHFEVRDVSTIKVALDAPTITQLMFDLCSAPCKARRFAPPAHARGLRALTVPARRSCLSHYVMAGGVMMLSWTDQRGVSLNLAQESLSRQR